jgi:hypothetical protein
MFIKIIYNVSKCHTYSPLVLFHELIHIYDSYLWNMTNNYFNNFSIDIQIDPRKKKKGCLLVIYLHLTNSLLIRIPNSII